MTKLRNKIVLVLLALCLVACMVFTVACGGDDEGTGGDSDTTSVTYTVYVKIGDEGVAGVTVNVAKGAVEYNTPKTTDADGKVEFSLPEATGYSVWLEDLPAGFEVPSSATLTFDGQTLIVNLAEKADLYKVKLVNPDGTAYTSAATVAICEVGGNCLSGVTPDSKGVARIEAKKGNYHIKVSDLPEGYAVEADSEDYVLYRNAAGTYATTGDEATYVSLTNSVLEKAVTVYPVNVLNFASATPLTEAQIAAYANKNFYIEGYKAYEISAKIPAQQTAYYSFTAQFDGIYFIYAVEGNGEYKANKMFLLGNNSLTGGNFNRYGNMVPATQDSRYYLNVTNPDENSEMDVKFIVSVPSASYVKTAGAGTYELVINQENVGAVIALEPVAAASFRATVQGSVSAVMDTFVSDTYAKNICNTVEDGDYKTGSQCKTEIKFTTKMIGGTTYIGVYAKADKYPTTVTVKIERVSALSDTTNVIAIKETLTDYAAQEGVLKPIAMTAAENAKIVKDGKIYRYGQGGPQVVVALDRTLDNRSTASGKLAYLDQNGNLSVNPYVLDVTTAADKADLTKGNTYSDYRIMLRGFDEYKPVDNNGGGFDLTIPTDGLANEYYVKRVNADGVYPLTEELKTYLEAAATVLAKNPASADAAWLFACYYYGEEVEEDPIVGEYTVISMSDGNEEHSIADGNMEAGEYMLTVNEDGTFVIMNVTRGGSSDVYSFATACTWKNEGGVYTFTAVGGGFDQDEQGNYNDLVFTVIINSEAGTISLIGDDDASYWIATSGDVSGGEGDKKDPVIAEYESMDGKVLTVNDDYTFKITDNGNILNGTWVKAGEGEYEFTENNPTFGEITYTVYLMAAAGEITFYDIQEDPDNPAYAFYRTGSGDDNNGEQDAIVGEYLPAENSASEDNLIVNSDGSFGMGDVGGTWVKNENDLYYTFTETTTQEQKKYTVEFDEYNDYIAFYAYGTDLNDFDNVPVALYAFNRIPEADQIVGLYQTDSMNPNQHSISVLEDNTYVRDTNIYGTWEKNEDGTYTFTETVSGDKYIVEYNDGHIAVYDYEGYSPDEWPVYELDVVHQGGPGSGRL